MMRIRSPLEFPNGHACLKIEQADRLEDERLSDLLALGMPSDGQVRLTIKGEFFDGAFVDYSLELYGFWPEDLEPNRRDQRFGAPDYTLVNYPSNASGHIVIFKACYYFWLQRVRYGSETVRELVWHPDVNDYLSIKRNVWVRYADGAKTLLSHIQNAERCVGRPVRFKNKEQFLTVLEETAQQLESDGQSLTQPNIAELIEADERDIRRGCKKFKVDWPQWKRNRTQERQPDKNRN